MVPGIVLGVAVLFAGAVVGVSPLIWLQSILDYGLCAGGDGADCDEPPPAPRPRAGGGGGEPRRVLLPEPPDGDFPLLLPAILAGAVFTFVEGLRQPVGRDFHQRLPGRRPYRKNSFTRKPSAVIGTSPGAIGTAVAQQSLRNVLSFCNSPQMNAPEAYIQFTPGLINDDGGVTNDATAEFLQNYMAEFAVFIGRVYTVLPRSAGVQST